MKAPLGHAHVIEGLGTGRHYSHGVGVCHTHILPREDEHAAKDETRVFASVEHAGQPIQGSVGVGTAQALDKGADRVEMDIAIFVVENGASLDGFFGHP